MKPDIRTPASHRDDPITSYEAEQLITGSGKRATQQQAVFLAVCKFPGRTSAELSQLIDKDRAMVARRLPELVTGGFIEKGEIVKCKACGSNCVTWYPTVNVQDYDEESN